MAKEKSLKARMLSALVSLVLAFGLLPALPAAAFAAEGGTPQVALTADGQALAFKDCGAKFSGGTTTHYYKLTLSEPASELYLLNAGAYDQDEGQCLTFTYEWGVFPLGSDKKITLNNYKWEKIVQQLSETKFKDEAIDVSANDYFLFQVTSDDDEYVVCVEQPKGADVDPVDPLTPQIALAAGGQALDIKRTGALGDNPYYKVTLSEPVTELYLLNADPYDKEGGQTISYGYSWTTQLLGSDGKFNLGGYKWLNAFHEYDTDSYFYDGTEYVPTNDYFVIIFMVGKIECNVCIEQPKGAYFGPTFSATAGGEPLKVKEAAEMVDGMTSYVVTTPADATSVFLADASAYEEFMTFEWYTVELGDDGAIDLASIAFDRTTDTTFDNILSSPDSAIYVLVGMDVNWDYQCFVFEVAGAEEPAGPSLSLGADEADLKVGQEFTVNVSMENITAAAQVELTWSENLQLVKVEAGSALSGEDMAFENVEGNGLFSFVANEGEADGVVAVATFRCIAPGEAAVGLTEGLAGKTIDSAEYEIADPEALELSVALAGMKGDVNNNTKINIVDAQIAYDLACGKYVAGSDAAAALLACWGNGATLPMVEAIADVNGEGLDATDAFAIQYYVHHGKFGE